MLDHDQTYFGCGNKFSAHRLQNLLGECDYSFLLPDNNVIKTIDGYLYSSIDTVFPFTSDISTYARATVLHCANDLYASGVKPIQACVSIGISASLNDAEIKFLFKSLLDALSELDVSSVNYHTFMADQTSITVSMNGTANDIKPQVQLSGFYDVFLTKPIGVWATRNYQNKDEGCYALNTLLDSNYRWMDFIRSDVVKYSTDISGFGLIGHVASILESQQYSAKLNLSKIISPLGIDTAIFHHGLGCSAKSNIESFGSLVGKDNYFNDVCLDVLFGGEINGPILVVVERDAEKNNFLKKMLYIGTMSPYIDNQKKIEIKV